MDNILSVALAVFIGISIYKKFLKRMKSTKSIEQKPEDTPANYAEKIRQYKEKHSNRTLKKSRHMNPIRKESPAPQNSEIEVPEVEKTAENSEIPQDFDLRAAIIYSEILKPKFDEK